MAVAQHAGLGDRSPSRASPAGTAGIRRSRCGSCRAEQCCDATLIASQHLFLHRPLRRYSCGASVWRPQPELL